MRVSCISEGEAARNCHGGTVRLKFLPYSDRRTVVQKHMVSASFMDTSPSKSKTYAVKLNNLFKDYIQVISNYPLIGKPTDLKNIHVVILGDYSIFYEIRKADLVIHRIWDNRQDPGTFKIL